jgi:hypothetical protein
MLKLGNSLLEKHAVDKSARVWLENLLLKKLDE